MPDNLAMNCEHLMKAVNPEIQLLNEPDHKTNDLPFDYH